MNFTPEVYFLEIFKQGSSLKMSFFGKEEFSSTVRRYSQSEFSPLQIDNLCREAVSLLNKADNKGMLSADPYLKLKKVGHALWDQLISRNLKEKLLQLHLCGLTLLLDEELASVPWEILYDGKQFLCLKFNLGRLIRTEEHNAITQYRSLSGRPRVLILADATNDLKSAYREGLEIKNYLRMKNGIAVDFKSTNIETLYVKKNLRDYDMVHFAGHCEYDAQDPQMSGWVLSDGRFTVKDVLSMGEAVSLPGLVFSNACQSAKEEVCILEDNYQKRTYNLASAFLFSGVRHYLGTVCKIEDSASLEFAREFYANIARGLSVGEAVRLSRIRIISSRGDNCVFWMNYLLYGDPEFVFMESPAKRFTGARKKPSLIRGREKKFMLRAAAAAAFISAMVFFSPKVPTFNLRTYVLYAKAQGFYGEGRNEGAAGYCKEILGADPSFLPAYPLLAEVYMRMGSRKDALRYYFEYAFYCQKRNDYSSLAEAYSAIGWLYHRQMDYPKAMEFYGKALELSRRTSNRVIEAVVLRREALWNMDKGEYQRALELLTKSSEINRQRAGLWQHRFNLACDYFDLGLLFSDRNDNEAAREFYGKSRDIFEKLRLKAHLSDYYFNLGEIFLFEKEYNKALENYEKGLSIDLYHGNVLFLAEDYNMIGELFMEMEDEERAEENFKKGIRLCEKADAAAELAALHYNMGVLYKRKGNKRRSREYLRLAQDFYRLIDTPDYREIKEELIGLDDYSP